MERHSKENNLNVLYNKAMPYIGVVFLQLGFAGLGIIAKFSLNNGMSHYTFAVYRNLVAALFFAPFAFIYERKLRPAMTISICFKILILGLLEPVIDQNLYYAGMKMTTATFAAAMSNAIPAITFIMAWIFRLEKVNLRRISSQAKIIGTLATVGGAMIMTLVKGAAVGLPWTKNHVENSNTNNSNIAQHPIKGGIVIFIGCLCWGGFYVLQAHTLKSYPAGLSLTTLVCLSGSLLGVILTFVVEKNEMSVWSLGWDMNLLSAVYGGIICSGLSYYIQGIIMQKKGPVFVTAFNPLCMVLVAVMGSLFLSERTYIGRIVGAVVIVLGLYLVLWGKSKDENASNLDNDNKTQIDREVDGISAKFQNSSSCDQDLKCSATIGNDEVV